MNYIKVLLVLFFFTSCTTNFVVAQNTIRWISFEEAVEAQNKNPKKLLISIYTEWCDICKRLESETYNDNDIAKYINENFYPVRLNAETHDSIEFNGKKYNFVKSRGERYHELALELSHGNLMYPTQVFLDEDLKIIQSLAGYLSKDEMIKVSIYFGDDIFKYTSWNTYERSFVYNKNNVLTKY